MNNSPEALEVAAFVNLGGSGQYKVARLEHSKTLPVLI